MEEGGLTNALTHPRPSQEVGRITLSLLALQWVVACAGEPFHELVVKPVAADW